MKKESLSDQTKRAKARWLKRVMEHRAANSTQKCLAHAIADRLNCVTLDCWAAQPTLARDIGKKSIKTVIRAGRGLANLNLITLKRVKPKPGLRHAPVFLPEDMDRPVPKRRQKGAKIADTSDGESFLGIHTRSSSTEEAAEEEWRAARHKPKFNPKERDGIEIKLAEMFGPDGLDKYAKRKRR